MIEILLTLTLLASIGVLAALAVIDLRTYLLPNPLVASFALLGGLFHVLTSFEFTALMDTLLGLAFGGGLLFSIRLVANRIYNDDTLGLGDVKLMLAGGLWLGGDFILIAITLGAVLGFGHAMGLWFWKKFTQGITLSLHTLSIPAGPGFILGLLIAGGMKFQTLPAMLWP